MLSMIWIMFVLSTLHWSVNLAFLVAKVKSDTVVDGTIRPLSDLMNRNGNLVCIDFVEKNSY